MSQNVPTCHKMSQNDWNTKGNHTNDRNLLETTWKKVKKTVNDKNEEKWQIVIMTKNDQKCLKMTQKGPKTCFKSDVVLKHKLFNLWNAQKCK